MTQNNDLVGVRELFKQAWQLLSARWKSLLALYGIAILFMVFLVILGLVVAVFSMATVPGLIVPVIVVLAIVGLIGLSFIMTAQILTVRPEPVMGYRQALNCAWPMVGGMIGLMLLSGLIIFGGLVLFIIPGIIFAVWFSQATFVYILEKTSVIGALSRSKELVRGFGWPVFGRLALLGLIGLLGSVIIGMVFPTEQLSMTQAQNWEEIGRATEWGSASNTGGGLLDAIWNIAFGLYSLAFSYCLYDSLVGIKAMQADK